MKSCLIVSVIATFLCACAPARADADMTGCNVVLAHSSCSCFNDTLHTVPGHLAIVCSDMDKTKVPHTFPNNVLSIDFSNNFLKPDRISDLCIYDLEHVSLANNHISTIPENQFSECKVIGSLDMSYNEIENMTAKSLNGLQSLRALVGIEARMFEPRVFSGLTSLSYLSIVIHQYVIPSDLFAGLTVDSLEMDVRGALQIPAALFDPVSATLDTLVISSTTLQWIRGSQLAKLSALKNFTLASTSCRHPNYRLFQKNKNLETVYLAGIASLPRKIFANLNKLLSIKLQNLEDMPSELFVGLFQVRSLEVSKSMINSIPDDWFKDLWGLEELILRENRLSTLKETEFTNLHSLKVLDLSGNALRELKNGVITETIEEVNLSHNDLKRINVGNFAGAKNLTDLDLSNNRITKLEVGAFRDLYRLRTLNLSSNKLSDLPADLLATTTMLTTVDLSDNILSSIPDGMFLETTLLQRLDLSENILRTLGPSSHYPTNSLLEINFMYNNNFDCDCELYLFLKAIPNTRALGECMLSENKTSMYYFRTFKACSTTAQPISSTPLTAKTVAKQTSLTKQTTDPHIVVWLNQTQAPASSGTPSAQTQSPLRWVSSSVKSNVSSDTIQFSNKTKPLAESTSSTNQAYSQPNSTQTRVSMNTSSTKNSTSSNMTASSKSKVLPDSETSLNLSKSKLDSNKSDHVLIPQPIRMSTKAPVFIKLTTSSDNIPSDSDTQITSKADHSTSAPTGAGKTETTGKNQIIPNNHATNSIQAVTRGSGANSSYTVIPSLHHNITLDPSEVILYHTEVTEDSHRIAVISIVGVAVLCVLIIGGLVLKQRRRSRYEVSRAISEFGDADITVDTEIKPLKEVPSITIEKIDAQDNVKVEVYEP